MSWIGGDAMAPATPWTMRSAPACQACSVPVRNKTPHAREASISNPCETWMSRRQSNRSASAPVYTEKIKYGTQWLMTAKPARVGEWNDS